MKEIIENGWNFIHPIMPEIAIGLVLVNLTILVLWLAVVIFNKMGKTFGQGSITVVAIIAILIYSHVNSKQKMVMYEKALRSADTEAVEIDTNSVSQTTSKTSNVEKVNLTGRGAVISWVLSEGKSRGRNEEPGLPAVVVFDDENSMEIQYSYEYNERMHLGHIEMKKVADKLIGPWHQKVPFDRGEVNLSNTTERLTWEGTQTSVVENVEVRFKLVVCDK